MKMATCGFCLRRRPRKKMANVDENGWMCKNLRCTVPGRNRERRRRLSLHPDIIHGTWARRQLRRAIAAPKWRGVYR